MEEIIATNKVVYDQLAAEYQQNWEKYIQDEKKVLAPFEKLLHNQFKKGDIKILDAGCGVGLNSYLLSEHGFDVLGIDISENMVKFARENAPQAEIIQSDFLKLESLDKFEGIVAMAFIHLFPKKEVSKVFRKIFDLLETNGFLLLVTTVSKVSKEGFYEKEGYSEELKRFRKHWVKEELIHELENQGFRIAKVFSDNDSLYDKKWLNIIAQKKN